MLLSRYKEEIAGISFFLDNISDLICDQISNQISDTISNLISDLIQLWDSIIEVKQGFEVLIVGWVTAEGGKNW